MNLEDLKLKKEEIPILSETYFMVPIHPTLLNPLIRINPNLAQSVFPRAAQEWHEDLMQYAETLEDRNMREWIKEAFLKEDPKITAKYGCQRLGSLSWEDNVQVDSNGFASVFSISRNHGGSLYFNQGQSGCREFVPFGERSEYVRFSREKAKEFGFEEIEVGGSKGALVYVYAQHNIDYFPGALFLRNWALLYINEAIREATGS